MKIENIIIISILFLVAFLLTACSTIQYVPYYKDSRYLQASPYSEGFNSKIEPSDINVNNALDSFSKDEGSIECIGKSNGLFNSRGGLCLSGDQMTLLQTRGGNSTGRDSKIGQ